MEPFVYKLFKEPKYRGFVKGVGIMGFVLSWKQVEITSFNVVYH